MRFLSFPITLPPGGQAGRRTCSNAAWTVGGRARGRSGGRHCTAGQYGYVPLGRHLVSVVVLSDLYTHAGIAAGVAGK